MLSFLLAGQSNMSGRGDMNALCDISNENIFVLRQNGMEIAREPVVRDFPFAGAGLSIAFANAVHMMTGEKILLIPASYGGSSLDQWKSGEKLFENAVSCVADSFSHGATLSGILWHQGEADSLSLAHALSYNTRLTAVMGSLKKRIQEEAEKKDTLHLIRQPLPVIAGELGKYLSRHKQCIHYDIVNKQMHLFASGKPDCAVVSSKGLTDKGDTLHFSAESLRILGIRYASAWADIALTHPD